MPPRAYDTQTRPICSTTCNAVYLPDLKAPEDTDEDQDVLRLVSCCPQLLPGR